MCLTSRMSRPGRVDNTWPLKLTFLPAESWAGARAVPCEQTLYCMHGSKPCVTGSPSVPMP
jgi:hypothetical protein